MFQWIGIEQGQPILGTDETKRDKRAITSNEHIFMIDKADASEDQISRSQLPNANVIITESKNSWDASKIKDIRSTHEDNLPNTPGPVVYKFKVLTRKRPCGCAHCRAYDFFNCEYKDEVGELHEHESNYIQLPEPPSIGNLTQLFAFYNGSISATDRILIILKSIDGTYQLGLVKSSPVILTKTTNVGNDEDPITRLRTKLSYPKGTVLVKIWMLVPYSESHLGWYKPVGAKTLSIPFNNIIIPNNMSEQGITRNNYLTIRSVMTSITRQTAKWDKREMKEVLYITEDDHD